MADGDVDFGTDIDKDWSVTATGDLKLVSGLENAEQQVLKRLTTPYGELEVLGSPEYGNQSYGVLGETDLELAKSLIEIYNDECLKSEPRVETIESIQIVKDGNAFTIDLWVYFIGEDTPNNLVLRLSEFDTEVSEITGEDVG